MSALKLKSEGKRLEAAYPLLIGSIKGFWNIGLMEEGSTFPPLVDWYFPSLPKDWAERFIEQTAAARTDKALHAFFADSGAHDCVDWMWGVCLMEPGDFAVIHEAAKRNYNYEAGNWRPEKPHGPMWREPYPRRRGS